MESQIETMRGSIAALKKPRKDKKHKEKRDKSTAASSKSSKATKGANAASGKKKSKSKQIADDDVLSFEQKKDLSEAIQKLDGTKLEKVIQIIHEGVPEIRDVSKTPVYTTVSPHAFLAVLSLITLSRAPRKLNSRLTFYRPLF